MVWHYDVRTTKLAMAGYVALAFLCTAFLSATSIAHYTRMKNFAGAMGNDYSDVLLAYVVINVVALVFVVLTALGTYYNSVGIVMLFIFIQLPLLVAYGSIGIYSLVQLHVTQNFHLTLLQDMDATFTRLQDSESMNLMQNYLRCCGIMSPLDYKNRTYLPSSCCRIPEVSMCNPKVGHHWLGGCYPAALLYLLQQFFIVSMSGLSSIAIIIVGIGINYLHAVGLSSCTRCR